MGAMQGWGRLTVALMSALPTVLAGNAAVLTLVTVAAPAALMVWQLTMASNCGTGLVPCSVGGTGPGRPGPGRARAPAGGRRS